MMRIEKGTLVRVTLSAALAIFAVVLFILNEGVEVKDGEVLQEEFLLSAQAIDREVDRVLEHFGIEKTWVRRKEIADEKKLFSRVERRILIPPTIVPVIVNRELNLLAQRYNGRAVATENLRENSVTIHIILQQSIIQTVILKTKQDIKPKGEREQAKKT